MLHALPAGIIGGDACEWPLSVSIGVPAASQDDVAPPQRHRIENDVRTLASVVGMGASGALFLNLSGWRTVRAARTGLLVSRSFL